MLGFEHDGEPPELRESGFGPGSIDLTHLHNDFEFIIGCGASVYLQLSIHPAISSSRPQ